VSKLKGARAFGYDLGIDPDRGPILRRARDSGGAEATPIVPFLLHSGRGLIVYQPVYRDGAATATVAQRRAALLGFASGAFRAADLATAAISAIPAEVTVQLQQNGRPVIGASGVLHDTASASIHVADRTWVLVLHDPSEPSLGLPILMAVVGISLACLLGALVLVWSRNERMQELQRQAGQDSLTGLKNRRRFEEDLRSEMARSRRMNRTGALLMLDLDYFKRVNDSLGHQAGDRVIKEIAAVLRRRARETDVLARLGGDEFAIVLPRCDAEEARVVAEAIATAIREHAPAQDGGPAVTASVGIAMFGVDPRTSFESVILEADTAMYAAKDAGRDGVRVFDPVAVRGDA
jgi:diguanylate cyclase (GGDEF)-like protein